MKYWSPAEDDTIRQVWPNGGLPAARTRLPHRKAGSLRKRAAELNVHMTASARAAINTANRHVQRKSCTTDPVAEAFNQWLRA